MGGSLEGTDDGVAVDDERLGETSVSPRWGWQVRSATAVVATAFRDGETDLGLALSVELSEQLATRVVIRMGRRRGQVVIDFGSADDLERIVSEIVGSGPGLAPD